MNANANHITLKWKFRNALVLIFYFNQACSALCYECINNFENWMKELHLFSYTSCNSDRYLVQGKCKCTTKLNGGAMSTFEYNGMIKC